MTIEHQILTDKDGQPTAALIPWDQFRVIQAELEIDGDTPLDPEYKNELNRRHLCFERNLEVFSQFASLDG